MTRVTGWGRTPRSDADVIGLHPDQVSHEIGRAPGRGLLARGSGCSYGDAAQNSGGTLLALQPGQAVICAGGTVTAPASTTFEQLLRVCLPLGWTLPVLPGTRHLTLGGAIAADVHGKNHLADGSIGAWLEEIVLLDGKGQERALSPGEPGFQATVGGMGLTGIVIAATLRVLPVQSSWLEVTHRRCGDLDELMVQLDDAAHSSRWAVAWIDALAPGAARGRGVVSSARALSAAESPEPPLAYAPTRRLVAPPLPFCAVTPVTARAFNAAWWRRPEHRGTTISSLSEFFHPLDHIRGWNRAYGPRGFLQYQFVVPAEASWVLCAVLERLASIGATPFLGVLKRFGAASEGMLSFPRPGYSLALDLPHCDWLPEVLDGLDELVASVEGAVYLAKDARLSPRFLEAMYPRLSQWRDVQRDLDPDRVFRSDLDRRLGLVQHA